MLRKILRYILCGQPSLKKQLENVEQAYVDQVKENIDLMNENQDLEDQVKELSEQLIEISGVRRWTY